jgi:predicted nucleic acid-binding protein
VTEPVIMEVLAGARTEAREAALLRLLLRFRVLTFEPQSDFLTAARIYRRCRQAGITPRGIVDCMIAAIALRAGASLLSHDADLARIAEVIGIPLDEASLRAG